MSILSGPKLKFSHGLKMYVIFARSDKMRVIVPMVVKFPIRFGHVFMVYERSKAICSNVFTVTYSAWWCIQNVIVLIITLVKIDF